MPIFDRRSVLYAAGALSLSGGLSGCGLLQRPLLAADSQPGDYPTVQALRFFADELARLSQGRLQVEVYPSMQLGSQNDTLELAQFGGIDFVRINSAPFNVLVPETTIPSLPFLFRSIPHMRRAMDGAPGRAVLDALADHGLIGLAFYDSGARSIYTVQRPVRAPDDMKGLKIRVQTSDLFVSMIAAMGANATPMAYGEVYQSLVLGVIDGAENNFPSYESSRHFEAAPNYSLTRHVMAPEIFAMSKYSWDRLSGDDQSHVMAAAQASVPFMRKIWDERALRSRQIVEAAGVNIFEDVDQPAFAARMEGVWNDYASSAALSRLVEDIQNVEIAGEASP